jgi:hypothetical protein
MLAQPARRYFARTGSTGLSPYHGGVDHAMFHVWIISKVRKYQLPCTGVTPAS